MMKRLVVLVLCALVVGCGGGSSSGKMAMDSLGPRDAMDSLDPRDEERKKFAMGIALAIDKRIGGTGHNTDFNGTTTFEKYEIARGVLTNSDTDITITEEEIIEIIEIPGWTRAKFHGTSETQSFKDTFVIYTSDTDYVDFGYWLNTRNTDDPLSLSYVVDGFVFGPSVSDPIILNALDGGQATYSGPATGLFAKKSGSIYTMSGQFMADTVLKVEFGVPDPNDPEDKETLVIISGEVTDFTDIDSNIIDSDWKVTLQEVVHSPSGVYEGGETDGGGKWDFQFYGDLNTIDNPVQPAIIGGGFDNEFSNGVVAGVFATKK